MTTSQVDSQRRLNSEWTTVVALREIIKIARDTADTPTYKQVLLFASRVFPEVFSPDKSSLLRWQESRNIREYRQKAAALSQRERKTITIYETLDRDIEEQEKLIAAAVSEKDQLRRRLNHLLSIKEEIEDQNYTEQKALLRDIFKVDRNLPISKDGKDYREFELPNDRVLRIRLLHPDYPETKTGTDVIYEHYWLDQGLVRIVAAQYKIWDGKTLYKVDRNEKQFKKIKETFCGNKFCEVGVWDAASSTYRLPFCSAFLRPTDELQDPDTGFNTSGHHVPICAVEGSWQETSGDGEKLVLDTIKNKSVTQGVFEELFNNNMLGSRWLTIDELEEIYKKYRVLNQEDRIALHAQVFSLD